MNCSRAKPARSRGRPRSAGIAGRPRLRSVLLQELVKQDEIRRQMLDLSAPGIVGALRGSDQQSEDEGSHRSDKASAQSDEVFESSAR